MDCHWRRENNKDRVQGLAIQGGPAGSFPGKKCWEKPGWAWSITGLEFSIKYFNNDY